MLFGQPSQTFCVPLMLLLVKHDKWIFLADLEGQSLLQCCFPAGAGSFILYISLHQSMDFSLADEFGAERCLEPPPAPHTHI